MRMDDVVLTQEEILRQQEKLANQLKVSVKEAYDMLERGELKGKIIEAELHMLRFLLGE